MARVTVEDCLVNTANRFDLVYIAAKRARQLVNGAEPRVERGHDKATVIALREIAAGKISRESVIEDTGGTVGGEAVAEPESVAETEAES